MPNVLPVERRQLCKVYTVEMICPCMFGTLIWTGEGISHEFESHYYHKCSNCGHIWSFDKKYPIHVYERDERDERRDDL